MSLSDRVRTAVRNFLNISTDNGVSIEIHQLMDHDAEVFKDRIWYRGRANEIEELYAHIQDNIGNGHFWGSKPTRGMKIRKIHTGLPSLIVDTLTDVCVGDLYAITVDDPDMGQVWEDIAEENLITDIISDAVRDTLYLGDGAFKLSYDPTVSKLPIIEFYPADRVDFEYNRGRISAVVFKTKRTINQKPYLLKERYDYDSICLQGIISPSTLGIDVKKLDNAEAQREKEKTTLYTRNRVTDVLNKAIRDLVQASLDFYCTLNGRESKEVEVTVNFGGYANPSFEAQVETIGKAATSGIMSTKTQVDELYGDDKDDDWKAEEVKRIKEERGILEMNEPALNDFE